MIVKDVGSENDSYHGYSVHVHDENINSEELRLEMEQFGVLKDFHVEASRTLPYTEYAVVTYFDVEDADRACRMMRGTLPSPNQRGRSRLVAVQRRACSRSRSVQRRVRSKRRCSSASPSSACDIMLVSEIPSTRLTTQRCRSWACGLHE